MMFEPASRARPVLKWAGGKSGLLEQLIRNFPTSFERYFEPFLGGGATFLALRPGVPAVLNDFNPELVELYSVIRDSPAQLTRELDALSNLYCEEFFYELRDRSPSDSIARAARTVFLNKCGFNGLYRQNSKGRFNVPFGKRKSCPALYDAENIVKVSRRLQNATLLNADFAEVIGEAREGDFVYCDPPYEPLSPTSSFNAYNGGGFSQSEQRRLRDACADAVSRGATVAVSNSASPLIKDIYSQWDIRTIMARRHINSKGDSRGAIAEILVLLRGPSFGTT